MCKHIELAVMEPNWKYCLRYYKNIFLSSIGTENCLHQPHHTC